MDQLMRSVVREYRWRLEAADVDLFTAGVDIGGSACPPSSHEYPPVRLIAEAIAIQRCGVGVPVGH